VAVRVGDQGRTLTPLSPSGKVVFAGVTYEARSERELIDRDCNVVAVGGTRFGLVVRPAEAVERLPGQGALLLSPEERAAEGAAAEGRRAADDERRALRWRRAVALCGGCAGLLGGLTLTLAQSPLPVGGVEALVPTLTGAAGGVGLARWLYGLREEPAGVLFGAAGVLLGGVVGFINLGALGGVAAAVGMGFGLSLVPLLLHLLQELGT
jgi:hypothetical protein